MSQTVIRVENLSKQYRLGEIGTGSVAHDINRWWHKARGKEDPYLRIGEENDRTKKSSSDYVWAVRDINFEVKQGEAVGVIGRNGAGKSTLLKILSRTTSPTTGKIKIKGRIASLLEVGTGFHPDLTGRDNIFLNGAILGMTKKEIKKKFDEIVDFAGIEKYIDTPVKRYSSGMYVRLAFAVAAHLEPEILIVDEVLAVGDAEFQKKCLGKMKDVSVNEGRTVLFVSHHMGSIAQLCSNAILMNQGRIIKQDVTEKVIEYYLRDSKSMHQGYKASGIEKEMAIIEAFLQNENDEKSFLFTHMQELQLCTKILINSWVNGVELRIVVRDKDGKAIFISDYELEKEKYQNRDQIIVKAIIPKEFLRPREYAFTIALLVPHQFIIDAAENVLVATIIDGGSKYSTSEGFDYGYVFFQPKWIIN